MVSRATPRRHVRASSRGADPMTAATLLAQAGNPAFSSGRGQPFKTGGFASPPRGGFALEVKLGCSATVAQCLRGQTYEVGDSERAGRRRGGRVSPRDHDGRVGLAKRPRGPAGMRGQGRLAPPRPRRVRDAGGAKSACRGRRIGAAARSVLTARRGLRTFAGLLWGHSSAGRALAWHARGRRFDPAWLHHPLRPASAVAPVLRRHARSIRYPARPSFRAPSVLKAIEPEP